MTTHSMARRLLPIMAALGLLLLASGGCRDGATSGADDAVAEFMARVVAGDEVGARAYWAWDYPMVSSDQMALYSRLVRDLTRAGPRVGWESRSTFYYRDAAFSQPVRRPREAQVSQVEVDLYVIGPGQSRVDGRLRLVLARVPGTPQGWRILAVRTDEALVKRFANEVASALEARE